MSGQAVTDILLAFVGLAITWAGYVLANRATRDTANTAAKAIDAAAYERAREIYEGSIGTLRTDMAAAIDESRRARADSAQLRITNERMSTEMTGLRESNDTLRRQVTALRQELAAHYSGPRHGTEGEGS